MLRQRILKLVRSIVKILAIGYVCIGVLMMFFERSLVYPIPNPATGDWNPSGLEYEDVWIDAGDATRLHGWYLPHANSRTGIVYFHGNGEDVARCAPEMSSWRDVLETSILVMDYRGYGKSEGRPSETAILSDGVLASQWLARREQVSLSEIVLWGRSIGGGVVAGVSEVTHPRAIIMESTFDSLVNVAATHVRWIPVRWLMRNRYPSAARLSDYTGEFIQWHGDEDVVVPLASAEELFQAVPSGKKQFTLGRGLGHNDQSPEGFNHAIEQLIKRLGDDC